VTIYPKHTNNSNALGDKITPTQTITKSEIEKYNLIDLPQSVKLCAGIGYHTVWPNWTTEFRVHEGD